MGVKVGIATMEISGKYGSGEGGRGEMGDGGEAEREETVVKIIV